MAESLAAWGHSEPLANIQEAITDVLKKTRAAHGGLQEPFQPGSCEALAAGSESHHHVQTDSLKWHHQGPLEVKDKCVTGGKIMHCLMIIGSHLGQTWGEKEET